MERPSRLLQQASQQYSTAIRQKICDTWEIFLRAVEEKHLTGLLPTLSVFYEQLAYGWACSDFIVKICIQDPSALLAHYPSYQKTFTRSDYSQRLQALLLEVSTQAELESILRHFRHQQLLRIAWRELQMIAEPDDVFSELTALADTCITESAQQLYAWQSLSVGVPKDKYGVQQDLCVLCMGKLGGEELNFSSDIDLIFAYPDNGQTDGGKQAIDNERFFQKLVQQLYKVLHQVTKDGFVYRVDLRLRPYGDAGPLVMSFAALEAYYQQHGRDWERYALIKARVIAVSNITFKQRLQDILQPFVFRRYVDYGAVDALREMKLMVQRDVRVRGLENDIKRGNGGIRQIEFFVQVFQLLNGGGDKYLRQRRLLPTMEHLVNNKTLSSKVVSELTSAYYFLRKLEHRIQIFGDQQTHSLPQDTLSLERITLSMQCADEHSLYLLLDKHRKIVSAHFNEMLSENRKKLAVDDDEKCKDIRSIWSNFSDETSVLEVLRLTGFAEPQAAYSLLKSFLSSYRCRTLTVKARKRLDQVMPILLYTIARFDNEMALLNRVISLLESIVKRSVYLVLLLENATRLQVLLALLSASPWITELVSRYPILLEELLHAPILERAKSTAALDNILRQRLLSAPEDELEQQMNILRRFKYEQILRAAAADVNKQVDVRHVSRHLSATAMTILQHVQTLAQQECYQNIDSSLNSLDLDFAIIAYGKLGGGELNYGSDLDLVFIHNAKQDDERIYTRLAQRIISMLNTRTANGILYEVDTRLRPSGNSGLLVTSLSAFQSYQTQSAWTWEHQALMRARAVTGPHVLVNGFEQVRRCVLQQPRDNKKLQADIIDMREKMLGNESSSNTTFSVKNSPGGIIDIEFIAQYLVLANAAECPELLEHTNTIEVFKVAAKQGVLSPAEKTALTQAYIRYRDAEHRSTLHKGTAPLPLADFIDIQAEVLAIRDQLLPLCP